GEPVEFDWGGGPGEQEVMIEPLNIKAVHITGEAVEEQFDHFLEMAERTELNALMVDLKDESGQVLYRSSVPMVAEVGAEGDMFDFEEVAAAAADRDLYLSGRIAVVMALLAATTIHETAVHDQAT